MDIENTYFHIYTDQFQPFSRFEKVDIWVSVEICRV